MNKAYHILIEGKVTGVGFRFATYKKAHELTNLCGYVKNANHYIVEVVIQGDEVEVNKFIHWLQKGPSTARVDKLQINEIPLSSTLCNFKIR